jgi:hypothetical protein
MNPLLEYLNQIRPYINAVAINELAGSENLLGKHFHYIDTNGEKGQLLSPKRYFDVLSALIKAFGMVKIGKWTFDGVDGKYILGWAHMKGATVLSKQCSGSVVFYCFWENKEIIEHFTGTKELTANPPG